MRTINITFTVSERQYEYLKLAKSEQPNPQRIKMMLLSQAASLLRRMGEQVMQDARKEEQMLAEGRAAKLTVPAHVRKGKPVPAHVRKPNKVLTNSKADKAVPFTPTPLEDYEF